MKVVTAQVMAELEAKAYQQGCSEKDFMENAGRGIAQFVQNFISMHDLDRQVWLLCGKGNNGGDAFVAGRYLLEQGFKVTAVQLDELGRCSPLCQLNGQQFLNKQGKVINQIESFGNSGVILDGLFGTGFKGKVRVPYDQLIQQANQSGLPILAVDIPSGLNGSTGQVEEAAIQAKMTIFLGLPKVGFFLDEGWNLTGKLAGVDFGLPKDIVDQAQADFLLLSQRQVAKLLPPVKRNRHKYQAGYAIGLASSPSMPGAGLLASLAAFRTGSGMVRLLHPSGMEAELAVSPYELIKIPYTYDQPDKVIQLMQKASATFVGPGLGKTDQTKELLKKVMPSLEKPCVLDADALTTYPEGIFKLPPKVIMTPHTGEMQTLLKSEQKLRLNQELLHTCQRYCEDHQVTLILKGAPTFIFHPNTPIYVNPTGDPGMATAGSGDVLTGMLASLLSQGLDQHAAARLGVYLHGLAGEIAAKKRGVSYGLIATDIIHYLAPAYDAIMGKRQI